MPWDPFLMKKWLKSGICGTHEQCIRALFTVHKLHFSTTFLFKMGPTALFTHLKIISLQCFQFQFSISAKISSIQTLFRITFWQCYPPWVHCSTYYYLLIIKITTFVQRFSRSRYHYELNSSYYLRASSILNLLSFSFFLINIHTFLYLGKDKIKGQSSKNITLTSTKKLLKK